MSSSIARAQVGSEAGLGEVAGQLGIGAWLMLGKGEEKSGGRAKPSILADAFEAIIAAFNSTTRLDARRRQVEEGGEQMAETEAHFRLEAATSACRAAGSCRIGCRDTPGCVA